VQHHVEVLAGSSDHRVNTVAVSNVNNVKRRSQVLPGLPTGSSNAFSCNYNLDSAAVRPASGIAAESSATAPMM
jgi:hypothetical protein